MRLRKRVKYGLLLLLLTVGVIGALLIGGGDKVLLSSNLPLGQDPQVAAKKPLLDSKAVEQTESSLSVPEVQELSQPPPSGTEPSSAKTATQPEVVAEKGLKTKGASLEPYLEPSEVSPEPIESATRVGAPQTASVQTVIVAPVSPPPVMSSVSDNSQSTQESEPLKHLDASLENSSSEALEQEPLEQEPLEQEPAEQEPAEQEPLEQKPLEQEALEQEPVVLESSDTPPVYPTDPPGMEDSAENKSANVEIDKASLEAPESSPEISPEPSPVNDAVVYEYFFSLVHAGGFGKVIDLYKNNQKANGLDADTREFLPIAPTLGMYRLYSETRAIGVSVGPIRTIFGDADYYEAPLDLTLKYTLSNMRFRPYFKAGPRYHLASGDYVKSSELGLIAGVGLEMFRRGNLNFGAELSFDSSAVRFDTINADGSQGRKTIRPTSFVFGLFVGF